jgi:hypothetical protein
MSSYKNSSSAMAITKMGLAGLCGCSIVLAECSASSCCSRLHFSVLRMNLQPRSARNTFIFVFRLLVTLMYHETKVFLNECLV